ncbi:Kelch repeat-containing protein [Raphanus sativus]|nr:Kelch repeat-containing protein [Raphanus sativus]
MAVNSDIPDDDDNGGAPNKKPQEQPGEAKTATSLESLPIVLIENIVARVPICNYPAISAISKLFGRITSSPDLRLTRSQLAISDHVLYALLGHPPHPPSWYILNASSRLRRVDTLPPMPYGSASVAVGHEIYVIGGRRNVSGGRYLASVTVVDCRTHTCRSLPGGMRVARFRAAAGVIDGKIYVVGGCQNHRTDKDWVETFDLERQIWDDGSKSTRLLREIVTYDVVKENLYVLGRRARLDVYYPKESKLRSWLRECEFNGTPIIVFDPEVNAWKAVKGVYGLPPCLHLYAYESKMANLGGKLVILVGDQSQCMEFYGDKCIWLVEISLERRRGGEIWGKVERAEVVFETTDSTPTIELCRTVIV